VTTDRNTRHQQNLSKRVIAIVALGKSSWPLIKRRLRRSRLPLLLQLPAATRKSKFPSTPISAAAEPHGDRFRPVLTFCDDAIVLEQVVRADCRDVFSRTPHGAWSTQEAQVP
jgi:hypothetical protein